jgi:Spy/CpxP family protein refolding chaperone
MKQNRLAKRTALAAGLFFLCTVPGYTRAQSSGPGPVQTPKSSGPGPVQTPKVAPPVPRPKKDPTDYFAGLKFTDEQKAKIEVIHQDMKSRRDVVAKDQKLSREQREAMLDGYRRMENGQVFRLLTPEQQKEVRERIRAQRVAEQQQRTKQVPPK